MLPRERLAREQLARAYERAGRPSAAIEQYRAVRDAGPGRSRVRVPARPRLPPPLRMGDAAAARRRSRLRAASTRCSATTIACRAALDLAVRAFERAAAGRPRSFRRSTSRWPRSTSRRRTGPRPARRSSASWRSFPESAGALALQRRVSRPRRSSDGGARRSSRWPRSSAPRRPRPGRRSRRPAAAGVRRFESRDLDAAPLDADRRRAHRRRPWRPGAYGRAQSLLLEEYERSPRSPELLRLLGGVLFVTGEYLDSAIALKKAEALAPLDAPQPIHPGHGLRRDAPAAMGAPRAGDAGRRRPAQSALPVLAGAPRLRRGALCASPSTASARCSPSIPATSRPTTTWASPSTRSGDTRRRSRAARRRSASTASEAPTRRGRRCNLGHPARASATGSTRRRRSSANPRARIRASRRRTTSSASSSRRRGGIADAIAELGEAARLDPRYAEPHYVLARLHRRAGDTEKADRALERFLAFKKEKGRDHSK